ncbi:hypothetical protein ACHAWX_005988 [Stephanocyclus meneghinianus]
MYTLLNPTHYNLSLLRDLMPTYSHLVTYSLHQSSSLLSRLFSSLMSRIGRLYAMPSASSTFKPSFLTFSTNTDGDITSPGVTAETRASTAYPSLTKWQISKLSLGRV